jgi:Tfp pilus assembly protein FimT
MSTASRSLRTAIGSAMAAALLMSACSSSDAPNSNICQTDITGSTSPATGPLTLTGRFYSSESVLLRYLDNGQTKTASGTRQSDRTAFTLTGLPSDSRISTTIISRDAGQEDNGSRTFSVQ